MALDLTKLSDAVAKVAALAAAHADVSATVASVTAERDAALADLAAAQHDIDDMTDKLIAAATTPAGAVGLAAVAAAVAPAPPTADDIAARLAAANK